MPTNGYAESDRKVEAEGEVAADGVSEANGLRIGMIGAVRVEGEETMEWRCHYVKDCTEQTPTATDIK